jgi:hypothetical protein
MADTTTGATDSLTPSELAVFLHDDLKAEYYKLADIVASFDQYC